ncbi:hypothetical protein GIX45_11890 [Erwinia sp. CPCC 100877]|nr:hypothetical protein [Erwinia sp. CPCC 100877]
MREINNNEMSMVSGAGRSELLSGLNNALEHVNTAMENTKSQIDSSSNIGQKIGLSYKAFGLSIAQHFLSFYSKSLSGSNS